MTHIYFGHVSDVPPRPLWSVRTARCPASLWLQFVENGTRLRVLLPPGAGEDCLTRVEEAWERYKAAEVRARGETTYLAFLPDGPEFELARADPAALAAAAAEAGGESVARTK
jgi:hypothetical protein